MLLEVVEYQQYYRNATGKEKFASPEKGQTNGLQTDTLNSFLGELNFVCPKLDVCYFIFDREIIYLASNVIFESSSSSCSGVGVFVY